MARRSLPSQSGEFPEILRGGCQQELVIRPAEPTQSQAIESQDALEMRKQRLDLLAVTT